MECDAAVEWSSGERKRNQIDKRASFSPQCRRISPPSNRPSHFYSEARLLVQRKIPGARVCTTQQNLVCSRIFIEARCTEAKSSRTRLDATTNWAVATTGIAISVVFSNSSNSPLPLVLVALMSLVFLSIEARRYRYFDIWRTRVRLMETDMSSTSGCRNRYLPRIRSICSSIYWST